jgi:enoyl-CoA hydratase/carnithine racemase
MTDYEFVKYEQRGPIAIVTMNRYERRNSTSRDMMRDMNAAFERFELDPSVRLAILTGVRNCFSSGADAKDSRAMAQMTEAERAEYAKEQSKDRRFGVYQRFREGKILKPVIAAVNGHAIGAGAMMAWRSDLVVAAEDAYFQLREIHMGLMDAGGRTFAEFNLPYHVGLEISLGLRISAQRAYEIGLVNRVVPKGQALAGAIEMAEELCELPPLSVQLTVEGARRLVLTHLIPSITLMGEYQETEVLMRTEDSREAFAAFLEKRKPVFKGR